MSMLKWTLAMAGTVMTVRYLADRSRQGIADGTGLAPQTDRDDAGSFGSGSGMASGSGIHAGMGSGTGIGSSIALGSGIGIGSARTRDNDMLPSDDDLTSQGSSSDRL